MHRSDEPALRLAVALANDPATSDLRRIFDAVAAGDHAAAVATINALIADAAVVPRLVDHDLVYVPSKPGMAAEAAMALALLIADTGFDRLRICASPTCHDALIDLTRNASRRFCTPQCANRHHVTAYRRRRRLPITR